MDDSRHLGAANELGQADCPGGINKFQRQTGYAYFPIDERYVLGYRKSENVSVTSLYHVKVLLQKIFAKYERRTDDLKKLNILRSELDEVLNTDETFFFTDEDFEHSFSFIGESGFSFALLENDKVIINKKIVILLIAILT